MADIEFERRGLPLWKVLLGLLVAGAAAFGGYELLDDDRAPAPAPAAAPASQASPPPAPAPAP